MKKQRIRPERRIYTDPEKANAVKAFDKKRTEGAGAKEAALMLGIPVANIFRWRADARAARIRPSFSYQQKMLNSSFNILYDGPIKDDFKYYEALCILMAWLRSSGSPQSLEISISLLLIATAKAKFNACNLSELPEIWLKGVASHIPLSRFIEICCINSGDDSLPDFPTFWYERLDDQEYDDRDELARMCWCLLALGGSSHTASLGKTIYIMNSGEFKYIWRTSRRAKERFWRRHAAAAPFAYVERFDSPLDWNFNPQVSDFLEKMNDLYNNHQEIRNFLRKVRTVIDRLSAVMDTRALQQINFPPLPDKIAPTEMAMPALTPSIIASLRGYKSAER